MQDKLILLLIEYCDSDHDADKCKGEGINQHMRTHRPAEYTVTEIVDNAKQRLE